MGISTTGWSNKNGTKDRTCTCGTWKNHWVNHNHGKVAWPQACSVAGCWEEATLGAHVIHPEVQGERIVPMCTGCNSLTGRFSLKEKIYVPSANPALTCR
jgi:hypothetical protein